MYLTSRQRFDETARYWAQVRFDLLPACFGLDGRRDFGERGGIERVGNADLGPIAVFKFEQVYAGAPSSSTSPNGAPEGEDKDGRRAAQLAGIDWGDVTT